jgi:outer membrane protein TolC
MNHRSLTVVVVLLLASAAARAQDVLRITLDDAIGRATEASLRLSELQARREAAEAAEAGRQAAARPSLALVGGYTRTNHVDQFLIALPGQPVRTLYPDVPDNYRARLDLQWPIYTGGRIDALERAARAERQASGEDVSGARADLRLEVTRAFWAVVTAGETERVLARSLESVNAHVRDLQARLKQGFIPPNEVLTAQAQQSRQRVQAIEASNTRAVAEADLRRLIGMEAAARIEPIASLDTAAAGGAADVEALIAQARSTRPERRALVERASAAAARAEATGASARPQVAVNAGYDYARPNPRIFPRIDKWNESWDVSANVSWSLFDGGRRRAEQAEAGALARAAETRVADFDRQVGFEVRARALELDSARSAIAAATEGVAAATEARRVVEERFAAGVATSTDLLDADTAVLQAELDRTRALANAHLAEARLQRAIGK